MYLELAACRCFFHHVFPFVTLENIPLKNQDWKHYLTRFSVIISLRFAFVSYHLHPFSANDSFQLISYLFIQSEKSKKAGNAPPTTLLMDFLKASYNGGSEVLLLEEDMNFNLRAASLSVSYSILLYPSQLLHG